jgi:pyruvate formate-lyase/glycerol dehydratase family glycyl radical enzyme
MGTDTFTDGRFAEQTLTSLPLLDSLRRKNLAAKPEVCVERAQHVTTFLRDLANPQEPMTLRYARAVHHFLSNKRPLFPDDNLLAGTTTAKPFGAPVYPELTGMTIWPELDTMSTRDKNPQYLSRQDADILNFQIFPYWMKRNILEATRAREGNPPCLKLFERIVFFLAGKAGTISHTVPCYTTALEKGLEWLIAEAARHEKELADKSRQSPDTLRQRDFYRATQIALAGIIAYAAALSREAARLAQQEKDPGRRKNLQTMAAVCGQVPARPARTFREAINGLWILQIAIHAENINMAISPGRLDQILFPWYWRDMANGTLTVPEAMELVGCLWLKLNDNTNIVPETGEELFGGAGTVPAVTIGGIDPAGADAVNDLTYIMLRVTELLKTRDPSLNARYYPGKNSEQYRDRVAEVIASTKSVPAFYNDIAAIRTLENQGIATADARDYAIIGCVELSASGRSYDASSSIMLNLVSALELALFNGTRPITGDERIGPATGEATSFLSFDQFWGACKTQLRWLIGEAVQLNEMLGRTHQEFLPTPLLSALFEGPMEKGQDLVFGGARYNSSGATHIGFADTVDSLNAIEQGVFLDRAFTFSELLAAIKNDFRDERALHAYLVNRAPKFGTEHPIAVKNAQNLLGFLYETYQGYTNYRGGKYRPAYWTMTNHAGQGKLSGALPNGRKAHSLFASGITPVSQAATELAACLNCVGSIDPLLIPGGEAFNLKYSAIKDQADLQRFAQAIEAYFRTGGLHIQFNIMSYQTLLAAKAHPDDYPELLVRVSGYSAYFKDLNEAMKDEIITRTAYDLRTGQSVPFPEEDKELLPAGQIRHGG